MKIQTTKKRLVYSTLCAIGLFLFIGTPFRVSAQVKPVKNIILVHGALADGSGWKAVYQRLKAAHYHVTIVQHPNTSIEEDVAAVTRAINKQDGPVILVGHSWGGTIITIAGNSAKVAGLVYVAAFQPDAGESTGEQFMSAPADKDNCLSPPDADGLIYGNREKYRAGFAADLPAEQVDFMFASQIPLAAKSLGVKIETAAWRTKPSWGIVPTADKSINPVIERAAYKRSKAKITEIAGASHCVYISHPAEVAKVIEDAANNSRQ